jgi:poly(3-hydroxybutyrate) depolymerase
MKLTASLLFSLLSIVGFAQHCIGGRYSETAMFDSSEIVVLSEIQYGTANQFISNQPVNLMLDIYMPSPEVDPIAARPFVLSIHGGGFISGDKAELAYQSREFARRGFVVANINYRLGWGCDNVLCINCFGTQMQKAIYSAVQDARAALRFAYANADEFGIDTDWIFISGESAGSITGMLATFWDQQEADAQVAAGFSATAGLLDESGNDLPTGYNIRGIINQCGAIPELSDMLDNSNIPMISFHDSNDCVVPYNTGALIACFCNGFLSYKGSNAIHNFRLNNDMCSELHTAPQVLPNHCSYPDLPLIKLSSCFLKRIMCGFCVNFADDDIWATPICSNLYTTIATVAGCTYESAENYNPQANEDDGSCTWAATPEICAGDYNMNGLIDVNDLITFLGSFGQICP